MAWNVVHHNSLGKTLKALAIRATDGKYWDGSAWQVAEQRLTLAETSGEYLYAVTGMADEGWIRVVVLDEGAGDRRVGGGEVYIEGGAELLLDAAGVRVAIGMAAADLDDQLDAISTVAATVTVLPLSATVSAGEVSKSTLKAYQYTAFSFTFAIVDSTGAAVNLSGKTLKFIAWINGEDDNAFELETGGGITIGGASNNQVTVASDDTVTQVPGEYRYNLRNMTDDTLLARGILNIGDEHDATP